MTVVEERLLMPVRLLLVLLVWNVITGVGDSLTLLAQDDRPQTELVKSAPRALQDLIRRGHVTIKFVPAEELPADEWGRCDFTLSFRRDFEFDAQSKLRGGKRVAIVKVTSMKHEIQIVHQIRLRNEFVPPRTWTSVVTWHEFDHVTIGSDVRPVLLLAYLAEHLPTIERPSSRRGEGELKNLAVPWINDELAKREQAVIELIRQNNRLLDSSSRHGIDVVKDRRGFFSKLYSKEHLAELKFPFLNEALEVFEQKAYREAEAAWTEPMPTPP